MRSLLAAAIILCLHGPLARAETDIVPELGKEAVVLCLMGQPMPASALLALHARYPARVPQLETKSRRGCERFFICEGKSGKPGDAIERRLKGVKLVAREACLGDPCQLRLRPVGSGTVFSPDGELSPQAGPLEWKATPGQCPTFAKCVPAKGPLPESSPSLSDRAVPGKCA